MTTRRPARHAPTPQPQPLLSHSTLTFIGHWRGQLLIVSICLFLGFIYFIIQEPIDRWQRSRRERSATKARGALLELENKRIEKEEREKEREDATSTQNGSGGLGSGLGSGSAGGINADRGRGGKRDGKRRKGSLLRVEAGGSTGPSSLEGSPAPSTGGLSARGRKSSVVSTGGESTASPKVSDTALPQITSTPISTNKGKGKSKAGGQASTPAKSSTTPSPIPPTPEIRLKRPEEESSPNSTSSIQPDIPNPESTSSTISTGPSTPLISTPVSTSKAEEIADSAPIPSSPSPSPSACAGPSRLTLPRAPVPGSASSISSGRSEVDDDEEESRGRYGSEGIEEGRERRASQGFSVFPEDGYLPPNAGGISGKKKKRGKGKNGLVNGNSNNNQNQIPSTPTSPTSHSVSHSRARTASTSQPLSLIPETTSPTSTSHITNNITSPPPTPHRAHSRKTSLGGRPFGMDLEDLLLERARTIDSLRAEIGVAKAEEAKAREEVERFKRSEESSGREIDRVRRAGVRVESELRKRESDLQRQLIHTNQLLSAQASRLSMIEQIIAAAGIQIQLPPPQPQQQPLSPLPPSSSSSSTPSGSRGGQQQQPSVPNSPMASSSMNSPYPMAYPSPMANGTPGVRGMLSPMMVYPSPSLASSGGFTQNQQPGGMLHPNFTPQQQQYQIQLQQQLHQQSQMQQAQLIHLHQQQQIAIQQQQHLHHHQQHQQQQQQQQGDRNISLPLSPSPFRRTSSAHDPDHPLAGALTPGILSTSSTYPDQLGIGRPRDKARPSSSSGISGGYRLPKSTSEAGGEVEGYDEEEALDDVAGGDDEEAGKKMDVGAGVGIGGEMDEERRASIAFSVLKVKEKKVDDVGVGEKSVVLEEEGDGGKDEEGGGGEVEGLGMGLVVNKVGSSFASLDPGINGSESREEEEEGEKEKDDIRINGHDHIENQIETEIDNPTEPDEIETDRTSSRASTSPSPKRMLVTPSPGNPDLPIISNDSSGPNTNGSPVVVVIRDGRESRSSSGSGTGSGRGRLGLLDPIMAKANGGHHHHHHHLNGNGNGNGGGGVDVGDKEVTEVYTPTFASLAHTPEQLKEIARMREVALRKYANGVGMGDRRGTRGLSIGSATGR